MKKLLVLGSGCARCQQLADAVRTAADSLGTPYALEKVTQIDQIIKFGVLHTPALVVDGVVKVVGRVPSVEEIKTLIA